MTGVNLLFVIWDILHGSHVDVDVFCNLFCHRLHCLKELSHALSLLEDLVVECRTGNHSQYNRTAVELMRARYHALSLKIRSAQTRLPMYTLAVCQLVHTIYGQVFTANHIWGFYQWASLTNVLIR